MTRAEALAEMARRLGDPDTRDLVQAINTSEDRGTALESTLRDMSEQMRQRKVQWMEKAAEEAKVHITWPAMVVMVACLIIVVAPMLLAAYAAGAGRGGEGGMGARILIAHGPDRGGSFVVPTRAAEVRIGRGPGMNIPVSDPSWQGVVRVMPRKAGYVVVNETPHTIYLGEEEFPRGQERTWYHGVALQPTAE